MIKRILAATAVSTIIGGGIVMAAATPPAIHIVLRAVASSHVTGTAIVVYDEAARRTTVTLTARGLTAGVHVAHIHSGRCGKNGNVKYPLVPMTASSTGTGASTTTFPYKFAGAALYINIHGVPGKPMLIVSCGNLS